MQSYKAGKTSKLKFYVQEPDSPEYTLPKTQNASQNIVRNSSNKIIWTQTQLPCPNRMFSMSPKPATLDDNSTPPTMHVNCLNKKTGGIQLFRYLVTLNTR